MFQLRRVWARFSRLTRRHRKPVRWLINGTLGLTFLTLVVQLAYPAGRVLPFVTVEHESLGGRTVIDATKYLQKKYEAAQVMIKTDKKTFTASYEEIGIDVRSGDTARAAARYSLGQRLIPFSSVYVMLRRNTEMKVQFDDDRLNYYMQQVEKDSFVAPINASIAVKGDEVHLIPAKPGQTYPAKQTATALREISFVPNAKLRLHPKDKQAERSDDEVKSVLASAQRAVNTPITLKVGQEEMKPDKTTIGSWLDFPEDPATMHLNLGLKVDAVKKYLEKAQAKIYKAPGTTRVQLIDGREVSRAVGEAGRGIDADKTVAAIDKVIKNGQGTTLEVAVTSIAPQITYDRQYSNSDAGLTALLTDLANTKGIAISVMEINGRSAQANGNKVYTSASIYKLYVAYAVFKQIEAGQMAWGDMIASGRNAESCFEVMMVRSDNPCAQAFGNRIGWQKIEDMMRGLGLGATDLSPKLSTTARDVSFFLYKLENGTLLSAPDKARLIDAMKRQIYRSGIPAGVGVPVADRVGFIDNLIHDAGIVYGPRGPYVLTIMSQGASWSAISDAARQIHAFLLR